MIPSLMNRMTALIGEATVSLILFQAPPIVVTIPSQALRAAFSIEVHTPEIVELIQSQAALPAFCTPVHSAVHAPEIAAHMESSHVRRFVITVMR